MMGSRIVMVSALLTLCVALSARADNADAARIDGIRAQLGAVQTYRGGLEQVVRFMDSRPDLFPTNRLSKLRMLTREQKEEVWTTWKTFLDYSMAMDSVRRANGKTYLIIDRKVRDESFLVAYSAFLAQYRFSLDFIRRVENDPGMDVLLNDSVPELGLDKDSYTKFKFIFLNLARGAEYVAFKTVWGTTLSKPDLAGTGVQADLEALNHGRRKDQLMTFDNALELVKKGGSTAWFPVQKGVSILMGDTKVWRQNKCLITQEQIADAAKRLLPGDVMLERREWYMSNIGLPGFWPHAVIFVDTPEKRKAFFNDPETVAWVKEQGREDGDFEALLKSKYPEAYALSVKPLEEGCQPRILEAIGEGVLFSALEHSMAADSLCALRPRLSKKERAVALFRAFQYVGRPYDFNFDFMTDSAIVCTELVYKSYQECPASRGLKFPMLTILGRLATPANELVRQFDSTFGTADQQYDLVLFLDGQEKERKAIEGTLDEFRKSWRRPKWHVVTQESRDGVVDRKGWAEPVVLEGLPNLHKVSGTLYRGAQPLDQAGYARLKSLGVKTVISLRAFHSDREWVEANGLKYEEIKFNTWHPEEEDVVRFLKIVTSTNQGPVFVHCQHGADRTGMMCAIYRMTVEGWSRQDAMTEMTKGGFGFHSMWKNLLGYLEKIDVPSLRKTLKEETKS